MTIRDGRSNFAREALPSNSVPQTPTSKEIVSRVREKIKVVREKGYVFCDQGLNFLTHLFRLPRHGSSKME